MVVIVLYAFMVMAVFWQAALTWAAIGQNGKLNRIIEEQLRVASEKRIEDQKKSL